MKGIKRFISVFLALTVLAASALAVQAADVNSDAGEGEDTNVYFDINTTNWNNYRHVRIYVYEMDGESLIPWNSKKGNMKEVEGESGIYSFDMSSLNLDINKNYGCIFLTDVGAQTNDIIVNKPCFGHTAYCTEVMLENPIDSNKSSREAKWDDGVDSSVYAAPLKITSIGNVIGSALPTGVTRYSLFLDFLSSGAVYNAVRYSGKRISQTVYDAADALGLSEEDTERAIAESKVNLNTIPNEFYGDVNDDGSVNIIDRITLTRFLANWEGYDDINRDNADVNDDGTVNMMDRVILTRHLAGWGEYLSLPYATS